MSETDETGHGLRTPGEYVLAALTALGTVAFAVLFVFGLPAAAAWRLSRDGVSVLDVVLTVVATIWVGILVFGVLRDRETRGWLVFALVGWLALPLVALARSVRGNATRD